MVQVDHGLRVAPRRFVGTADRSVSFFICVCFCIWGRCCNVAQRFNDFGSCLFGLPALAAALCAAIRIELALIPIQQIPFRIGETFSDEKRLGFVQFGFRNVQCELEFVVLQRCKNVAATEAHQHHQAALHCFGHALDLWVRCKLGIDAEPGVGHQTPHLSAIARMAALYCSGVAPGFASIQARFAAS